MKTFFYVHFHSLKNIILTSLGFSHPDYMLLSVIVMYGVFFFFLSYFGFSSELDPMSKIPVYIV